MIAEEDGDDKAESGESDDSQTEVPETDTELPIKDYLPEESGDMENEGIEA